MQNKIIIFLLSLLSIYVSISTQDLDETIKVPENLKAIVYKKLPKAMLEEYSWHKTDKGYGGATYFFEGEGIFNTRIYFNITNKGKFDAEYKIDHLAYSKYIPEKVTKKAIEACTKLGKTKPEGAYALVQVDDNVKIKEYYIYNLLGSSNSACGTKFNASGIMIGKAENVGAIEM